MTKLNELAPRPGSHKSRMRVGRGPGSGKGKTAGRGHKGAHARTGHGRRACGSCATPDAGPVR